MIFNLEIWRQFQGTYFATTVLACVGAVISSAEFLAISSEFRRDGIFSWLVVSSRPECVRHEKVLRRISFIFEYRAFVTIHVLRIVSCVLLPFFLFNDFVAVPLILIVAGSSLLLSFRDMIGKDGSDQMSMVIFGALLICALSHDPFIRSASLIFIALQSILSYVVAGIAKSLSPKWKAGLAIPQIMNTRTYGLEGVARLLAEAPTAVNKGLCWGTILIETSFFLVIFLPAPWFLIFLFWGVLFHVYNAVVMGLNTFFWSFIATYPCIVFLNHALYAAV